MKVFSRLPGVELLEICGEYLLVATKDARDKCPYVTQINKSAANYWKLFDKPYSVMAFADYAAEKSGGEAKEVLLPVLSFISKMSRSGYLIEEEVE